MYQSAWPGNLIAQITISAPGPPITSAKAGALNGWDGEGKPMDQLLGSKYTIGEQIGRGGMGQVFRGRVRETGEPVAVKLLKPELLSDPDIVTRFFRERSILLSTSHLNVARVLDLVVEGQTLAIVMELIEGLDLRRELTAKGTLPPAEAVRYGRELLDGLAAVHSAGIVHRDIKPENLLVDRSGDPPRLKLTDFGIARLTYGGSLTRLSSVIGTPEYMAPEIADHDSATSAADLYSTGIVLYEMLAGRTPFAGGHALAVLHRHLTVQPPPVPDAPPRLWALIDSLLAKDPAQRPQSAAEVEAALAEIAPSLAGLPALPAMAAPEFAPAQRRVTPRQETEVARLPTQAAAPAVGAGNAAGDADAETMLRPDPGHRQRPPGPARLPFPVPGPAVNPAPMPAMPMPAAPMPAVPVLPGPGSGRPRRRGLLAAIATAAVVVIAAVVIATQIVGHRPATALHLNSGSPSAVPGIKSLTITPAAVHLTQNHTAHLLLAGLDSDGSAVPEKILAGASWASADASVAEVGPDGTVTATGAGSTYITARIGAITASAQLTVEAPAAPPSTVIITSPGPTITVGPQPTPTTTTNTGLTPVYGYKVYHSCRAGGTCGLSVRREPHQSATVIGALSEGEAVAILCQTLGDLRTNSQDVSSDVWDELAGGGYVSDLYLDTNGTPVTSTQSGFDPSIARCP
jgi:Protein kinase domain